MRRSSFFLSLVLAATGCSLLVQFDPETQPCDALGFCRLGYVCVPSPDGDGGTCRSDDGGVTADGGADAGNCASRETSCGDGLDDDCDQQVDCLDTDCGGLACDDRNQCTTGDTCQAGTCRGARTVTCNAPTNDCLQATGSCDPTSGECLYPAKVDGAACGTNTASRCCSGQCKNLTTSVTDCGGCGLACAAAQSCVPIEATQCLSGMQPIDTSARCQCGLNVPCPKEQVCGSNGLCRPVDPTQCAPGQFMADGGTGCLTYCQYR